MPIKVTCEACGKTLTAKDDYAGKRTKCPGCGEPLTIPEPVYDAEQVDDEEPVDEYTDEYEDDYEVEEYDDYQATGDRTECRSCGEMIKRSAAKCRYCGEIFDSTIGGRGKRRGRGRVDSETIRLFRREMHGLGGFWIFIGVCAALAGMALAAQARLPPAFGVFIVILGLMWIGLGVATCLKQVWALWIGIVMGGLSILGNLANLPQGLCGLIFMIIAVIQAWKCIGRAKEMTEAGIPLNTTP